MIVIEDIEASEIHQFFVFDSYMQLGIVRAGKYIQTFDPERVFSYYNMVENQLYDFTTEYPGAFQFLPRRAYDYLKRPRFLNEFSQGASELSQSSWSIDSFMINPLIGFGEKLLPIAQQDANSESIYRWATMPPNSHRFYHLQDMRLDRRTPQGWGCLLKATDLARVIKGSNRTDLLGSIKSQRPIFIELDFPDELDPLLEWLILLKDAGLNSPNLVLKTRNQKEWNKELTRLLDIPNTKILTAGATISSLSTIIRYLRKEKGNSDWSRDVMFASSYPETHLGDGVSEIISYLFSRNLAASEEEVQRILGGNLLSILPPRPPFLVYTDNKMSVVAEENLAKAANNELVRILQLLDAKNVLRLASIDHMINDNGGSIDLDSAVITVIQQNNERATSLAIMSEKNGALMISGWKKAFSESLLRRDGMLLQTLVRANAKLDGPIYGSPAHLVRYDETLLACLQVENPRVIMSALHFGIEIAKIDQGTFRMCRTDMDALDVKNDDYVLALESRTGQYCAGLVKEHSRCSEKSIVISEKDAKIIGFRESSVVNIVKVEDEVTEIDKIVLSYTSHRNTPNSELLSYIRLHYHEIVENIDARMIGMGSRLNMGTQRFPLTLSITQTEPRLTSGQIAKITSHNIHLRPLQAFRELNIVLCVSKGLNMNKSETRMKSLKTIAIELEPLTKKVPELEQFLKELDKNPTQAEIAAICSLLVVNMLSHNQTKGKLALVTFADTPEKFSIQHGGEIQPYVEFDGNLQSDEVLISLVLSILDKVQETGGREDMVSAYRSIAEYLEDFGTSRPTMILLFTGSIGKYDEEHLPFLKAISERERYQIEIFVMNRNENLQGNMRVLKGLKARVIPLERFTSQIFLGHVLDVIDTLVPATINPQSDV
ncbi:VWA domain-containing protein [Candidatus Thorarchaeota archaeon]|nr:MAG: VWA domain-containing protein [Candidatus Thorarchaeota archaeon]